MPCRQAERTSEDRALAWGRDAVGIYLLSARLLLSVARRARGGRRFERIGDQDPIGNFRG